MPASPKRSRFDFHDHALGWVVDPVAPAILTESAQLSFERPVVQLLRIGLAVDECSGSDG